jgi:hypothetical protein
MGVCVVSFVDPNGVRHSVEVRGAESLYEAATLALIKLRKSHCKIPEHARLEVQLPGVHHVTPHKLREWLYREARNPKEKLLKNRLIMTPGVE